MYLHLPRRYRRRLLLPPGLVALAGLLLLGCLALRPWQERLKQRSVIELTMPPRPISDLVRPNVQEMGFTDCIWPQENGPEPRYSLMPHYRRWFTLTLGQNRQADSLAMRKLKALLHRAGKRPNWGSSGLRIFFSPKTHYSSVVEVLGLMNQFCVGQYFLDIYHMPVTFYALTIKPMRCPPMPE